MHKLIANIVYSVVALFAFGFAAYAPYFTQKAVAGAAPQLYARDDEIHGFVVGVTDGDTLKIVTQDRSELRIRLAEIDAPEKGQPFSDASKRSLSDLAYNKPASVRVVSIDRYGRVVGRVYVGTLDLNLAQVGRGLAWAYTQYLTDQRISQLEARARKSRIGLWADTKEPVAPWLFRRASDG